MSAEGDTFPLPDPVALKIGAGVGAVLTAALCAGAPFLDSAGSMLCLAPFTAGLVFMAGRKASVQVTETEVLRHFAFAGVRFSTKSFPREGVTAIARAKTVGLTMVLLVRGPQSDPVLGMQPAQSRALAAWLAQRLGVPEQRAVRDEEPNHPLR